MAIFNSYVKLPEGNISMSEEFLFGLPQPHRDDLPGQHQPDFHSAGGRLGDLPIKIAMENGP